MDRGRMRRVRAQVAAAPPRLLDWMSTQVVDHPAVLYDVAGVEELAARQTRSIGTAVGALQLALLGAAAASTLEGGPFLAVAIDGVVGQVAAVVHGMCDWYNTGSYLVRRLDRPGHRRRGGRCPPTHQCHADVQGQGDRRADARTVDRVPPGAPVGRQRRRGRAPFGSSLGKASVKAAERIDGSDLAGLVAVLRPDSRPR